MAEKQQDHRIGIDRSGVRRANWGLGAGFATTVLGLSLSAYVIMHGHEVGGSVLGGATILGLVTAFIQGSKAQSQENIQNARLLTGQDLEEPNEPMPTEGVQKQAKKRRK